MLENTSQSEIDLKAFPPAVKLQRVNGAAAVSLKKPPQRKRTCLDKLYQQGSAKLRFPKTYEEHTQAVLINTAGGLTGGDRLEWNIELGENTKAVATTQACEKILAAADGMASVTTRIRVGPGADFHWLPQETILFNNSALKRTLSVELAHNARFIGLEACMLGRQAMGETVGNCYLHDRWRISREGKLIFADDVKLEDDIREIETATALLNNNKAWATILYAGTEDVDQLDAIADKLRQASEGKTCGISAFENKLVIRAASRDFYELRQLVIPLLSNLPGCELPKIWRI